MSNFIFIYVFYSCKVRVHKSAFEEKEEQLLVSSNLLPEENEDES